MQKRYPTKRECCDYESDEPDKETLDILPDDKNIQELGYMIRNGRQKFSQKAFNVIKQLNQYLVNVKCSNM